MFPASKTFAYRIDAHDRVQLVSDAWVVFAAENGAPELARELVCGTSLWDFVSGRETRHIYELLFERARRTLGRYVVPFRCDAPGERRQMELIVNGRPDKSIDLTGVLLSTQPRAAVSLLDPATMRTTDIMTLCSWCKRVHMGAHEWVEVEEAVGRLGLFDAPVPQVSHGMCDDCVVQLEAG